MWYIIENIYFQDVSLISYITETNAEVILKIPIFNFCQKIGGPATPLRVPNIAEKNSENFY